jgi:hypothetical protein
MTKRRTVIIGLALVIFLFFTFAPSHNVRGETLQGWTIENSGGSGVASDDGSFRLTTPGGYPVAPCYTLVRHISPVSDFNYSLQMRANTVHCFEMFIRQDYNAHVVQLQHGSWAGNGFLLARTVNTAVDVFAYAPKVQAWYTLQLNVYKEPFHVTALVIAENGNLLGTMTITDVAADIALENITSLGFRVWGYGPSDYSVRNIEYSFANPSQISISTSSLSSQAGSAVNVMGRLTDSNDTGLQNKCVILSYTFPGVDEWFPVTSDQTDENGEYNIQWINSASGTFSLKTQWNGDGTFSGASNSTSLSFLPYEGQHKFIVESNSSLTELAFNSTSSELSFTVAGDAGTKGFVKVDIAKELVVKAAGLKVTLDGNNVNYTLTESDEFWTLSFEYSHSTHEIAIHMGSNMALNSPSPTSMPTPKPTIQPTLEPTSTTKQLSGFLGTNLPVEYGCAIVAVSVTTVAVGLSLVYLKRFRKN